MSTRAEAVAADRARKFAVWFETRRWRVIWPFSLPKGQVYQDELRYKARNGFLCQEVDPVSGADLPSRPLVWGRGTLERAVREYQAVTGFEEALAREPVTVDNLDRLRDELLAEAAVR